MKKIIVLLILLVFPLASAQNVFKSQKQIYLAQYYAHLKNNKKALECYLKAINFNSKINSYDYLNAAVIAFKLDKRNVAKNLLIKSVTKQQAPLELIKNYKSLKPYQDSKEMKGVLDQYDDFENQYFRELKNPKAYMEIQNLIAKDQIIRQDYKVFGKLAKKTDSANITKLMELTQKYGWEDRAWVLLWHHRGFTDEQKFVWNFFKPYLESEIKKDNVNKDFFVDFEEFDNSSKDFDQRINLGSIYTCKTIGNINGCSHFKDIKNLDKRRKSVGLPPLYFEYFLNNNSQLPEGYEYNPENLLKDLEDL